MPKAWHRPLVVWLLATVILLFAFWPTWIEIGALWQNAEAFAHGPLVPLLSAWLVWRIRKNIVQHTPTIWPLAAGAVLVFAMLWWVGDVFQVAAVRHFAVMLMLIALCAACFGKTITVLLSFPLGFLLFAVPFGDFLVEPMMNHTADFTVWALRLVGVPVYREARLLQIPSGNWSVVEACSGTRYLVASVMLGALYAYLFYRSFYRRALFVIASIIMPVLANWLRAFLIVMVGHLSENKYGIGADHIIFGWLFFGVIIFAMFSIGARWREDTETAPESVPPINENNVIAWPKLAAPVIASVCAACVPYMVSGLQKNTNVVPIAALNPVRDWSVSNGATWKPEFTGDRLHVAETIKSADGSISIFRARYAGQRGTYRMIRWGNTFVSDAVSSSASVSVVHRTMRIGAKDIPIVEYQYRDGLSTRVVRGIYASNGALSGDPYRAKLYLAQQQLMGQGDSSVVMAWSALANDPVHARRQLDAFTRDFAPQLLAFVDPKEK